MKENIADIKYNKGTTALTRLCNKEPLQIDFEKSKIIYPSRFYLPSIIVESIEMFLRSENICTVFPRISRHAAKFEGDQIFEYQSLVFPGMPEKARIVISTNILNTC